MTTPQNIALKGSKDGLILYLNPDIKFGLLMSELKNHLQKSSQFLQGAAVRCFGGERRYSDDESEQLQTVLKDFGMEFQGFLSSEEVQSRIPRATGKDSNPVRNWEEGMEERSCLLVKRTIRSGQSIKYDGHVLVLGDVNPGAEIIATGNIFVMGILRGVAHAGAVGDRTAVITAYQLLPTQVRIADIVTRAPAEEGETKNAEIARIKEGQLIVESLVANGSSIKGL